MEGLSTLQAKEKMLKILEEYRYLNTQKPVKHIHLSFKSVWSLEILALLYGLFLVFDYIFLSSSVESLIIGIFLLILPLRYLYYKANRSKFQWEIFDDRIKKIYSLVNEIREGEDMSHVTLRSMNNTISEVYRDNSWVKLPSIALLEDDLVALRPGMILPVEAYGLDGHYKDKILPAFEVLPQMEVPDICEAKQKMHFVLKASPCKILLQNLLTDRGLKKKRTSTFFMVCLKIANKVFLVYVSIVLCLNFIFAGVWTGVKQVSYSGILVNPSFLFIFIMIVILPSFLHLLICWGNALLWCICESLDKTTIVHAKRTRMKHLDSILKGTQQKNPNLFEMKNLAEKAESDFDNEEMVNLFPSVALFECFSICTSFLIGGLQRDLNILDLLNSTTIMSFIDKDGIISENARFADEVIVMGPEGGIIALDLVHESPLDVQCGLSLQDRMAFIGNAWEEYDESLKPLGLATSVSRNPRVNDTCKNLINLNDDHPKLVATGELFFLQPKDEIEIFEECACIVGKLIGFTDVVINEYKHLCTLWSTWRPNEAASLHEISYRRINKKNNLNKSSAISDYIDKRISQAKRISTIQQRLLRPYHLLTSIIEKNGEFQVFSQGNPKAVLQNCKDYWDGNTLQLFDENNLQQLSTALLQWTADDYDAIAFSYKPLMSVEIEKIISDGRGFEDLDDATRETLQGAQREHHFLGMIAVTNHPKSEANHFIEDVFHAGIRFVIFSEGDLLETKAFGDDLGLYTAWNSCISLSSNPSVVEEQGLNLDGMKVLPQGIEEIKERLAENNDNVPLLVSMFSDSTRPNILEMVKVYQQHGEVVMVIGGCLHAQNTSIYQTADVSIGVKAQSCGFCSLCFGYRLNYKHTPGILETVSEKLIALPCTFTLGLEHPLYLVLQVIKEARKFMANIQNGLVFAGKIYAGYSSATLILLIFGMPPFITLLQCAYICFLLIPIIVLSFLNTPPETNSMKKLPIKVDILEVVAKRSYFVNEAGQILFFIAILVEMHVWALSTTMADFAFYQWQDSSQALMVQLCNFWFSVLLTCVYSCAAVNAGQSWFHVKSIDNPWWLAVVILQLVASAIIVVIYLAAHSAFREMKEFLQDAWYVYVAIFLECVAAFFLLELMNFGIWTLAKKLQKTLDVYFQTKLGVYSPK